MKEEELHIPGELGEVSYAVQYLSDGLPVTTCWVASSSMSCSEVASKEAEVLVNKKGPTMKQRNKARKSIAKCYTLATLQTLSGTLCPY